MTASNGVPWSGRPCSCSLACIAARVHCWLVVSLSSTMCYMCLCAHVHTCVCTYVFVYTPYATIGCHPSATHLWKEPPQCVRVNTCVWTYTWIYTSAGPNSRFSALSHAFWLSLMVTVGCLAFPNPSAVTHTLPGCASQLAGLPCLLPWLCFR